MHREKPSISLGFEMFSAVSWLAQLTVHSSRKLETWRKISRYQELPGDPVVGTLQSHCQGPGVQSPVKELRSHKPYGEAKKKKKKNRQMPLIHFCLLTSYSVSVRLSILIYRDWGGTSSFQASFQISESVLLWSPAPPSFYLDII